MRFINLVPMKRLLFPLSILVFAGTSCGEQEETESVSSDPDVPSNDTTTLVEEEPIIEYEVPQYSDEDDESKMDWTKIPTRNSAISVEMYSDHLYVSTEMLDEIALYVKIESSITIMDEGPHCDLTEWRHGYTEWDRLSVTTQPAYNANSFDYHRDYDAKYPFPVLDMDSIRSEVEKSCGTRWSDHIKNVESLILR